MCVFNRWWTVPGMKQWKSTPLHAWLLCNPAQCERSVPTAAGLCTERFATALSLKEENALRDKYSVKPAHKSCWWWILKYRKISKASLLIRVNLEPGPDAGSASLIEVDAKLRKSMLALFYVMLRLYLDFWWLVHDPSLSHMEKVTNSNSSCF